MAQQSARGGGGGVMVTGQIDTCISTAVFEEFLAVLGPYTHNFLVVKP